MKSYIHIALNNNSAEFISKNNRKTVAWFFLVLPFIVSLHRLSTYTVSQLIEYVQRGKMAVVSPLHSKWKTPNGFLLLSLYHNWLVYRYDHSRIHSANSYKSVVYLKTGTYICFRKITYTGCAERIQKLIVRFLVFLFARCSERWALLRKERFRRVIARSSQETRLADRLWVYLGMCLNKICCGTSQSYTCKHSLAGRI